jgi:hypothetical protein
MLGWKTAFDVRAACGRANLILNQDWKNQLSAETLELFQVGNQEIKLSTALQSSTAVRLPRARLREQAVGDPG